MGSQGVRTDNPATSLNSVSVDDVEMELLLEGIMVRPLKAYDMPQHIRVSIGTPQQNKHFLTTINKVMGIKD